MPKTPWYTSVQQAMSKLDTAIADALEDGFTEVEDALTIEKDHLAAVLAEFGPH